MLLRKWIFRQPRRHTDPAPIRVFKAGGLGLSETPSLDGICIGSDGRQKKGHNHCNQKSALAVKTHIYAMVMWHTLPTWKIRMLKGFEPGWMMLGREKDGKACYCTKALYIEKV